MSATTELLNELHRHDKLLRDTEHLEDKERIRIPSLRVREAAEVAKALETALTLVKPMIAMGDSMKARRRTA